MMDAAALLCPSAEYNDPTQAGSLVAFGDVTGTAEAPTVEYYETPIPITQEVVEHWREGPIAPGEIIRIAGTCKQAKCRHWNEKASDCSLIGRWVAALGATAAEPPQSLPHCPIRRQCRGWAQSGPAACRQCPRFPSQTVWMPDDPLAPAAGGPERTFV
jgi:hypothetical protein